MLLGASHDPQSLALLGYPGTMLAMGLAFMPSWVTAWMGCLMPLHSEVEGWQSILYGQVRESLGVLGLFPILALANSLSKEGIFSPGFIGPSATALQPSFTWS